jgi:hypothetical protein
MEYDYFVKLHLLKIMIFGLIHYMIEQQSQIINHSVQYWLCLL